MVSPIVEWIRTRLTDVISRKLGSLMNQTLDIHTNSQLHSFKEFKSIQGDKRLSGKPLSRFLLGQCSNQYFIS